MGGDTGDKPMADPTLDEAERLLRKQAEGFALSGAQMLDMASAIGSEYDRMRAALAWADRAIEAWQETWKQEAAALAEARAEIARLRAEVPTTDDVARAIHVAMHHPDGDPDQPCRIEYPGGFTFCDGPRVRDRDAADAVRALAAAPAPTEDPEWTDSKRAEYVRLGAPTEDDAKRSAPFAWPRDEHGELVRPPFLDDAPTEDASGVQR